METHLGREVLLKKTFNEPGDFKTYYAINGFLAQHGYKWGSTGRINDPVAISIGQYPFHQKWHNITDKDREIVDGVYYVERTGEGTIYLFNLTKTLLPNE